MRHSVTRTFPCLVSLIAALVAGADAATAGVATSTDQDIAAPSASPTPAAATGITQDKTVEMLLQLQDARASSGDGQRREAPGAATSPAMPTPTGGLTTPPAESAGVPSLRQGLINEAARFMVETRPETATNARRMESSGYQALPPPVMSAPRPPVRDGEPPSILSNPVIRFVRENRALALGGAVALLVAVWLTANVSVRRRGRR